MIAGPAVTETDLPLKLFSRGKVRDTYELGADRLLMVATDRISAFDHVLPNGIPDRGKVLTQLSIYWFSQTHSFQENHLVSGMVPDLPAALRDRRADLAGRFMIVRKAKRIDFECVVRGYLAGSAWKEYQDSHTLAGEEMPPGLRETGRLAYSAVWLGQGVRTAPAAGRHRGANTRAVPHRLPSVGRQAPVPTQGAQRVRATARVIVTPKPVVNDPQGLTVKQGLVTLGFREVEDVRIGKYIELSLEAETMHEARERVEAMCRQLLANHVIEDFHFELDHERHHL